MSQWDVFLSYARQDAMRARPVAKALADQGLSVFVDESTAHDFRSITRLIGTALGASKLLLALYSTVYPQRPACQLELTLAYLAGQEEGDPRRRVMVINPEPSPDHVHPIELRDARHWPATGGALADLAQRLARRASELERPIGAVLPLTPPRWLPRPLPAPTIPDARLTQQWELHSALHPQQAALITGAIRPGVAVVRGPGAGGFVQTYAEKFGSAYPGGIFWFTAQGYAHQVSQVCSALDPAAPPGELGAQLARLAVLGNFPALWVVDAVPPGVDPAPLLAPHPRTATILIAASSEADGPSSEADGPFSEAGGSAYDQLGTPLMLSEPELRVSMGSMSTLETPTERERLAAFDLQVELATRIGVQPLGAGTGSLREALTSLRSLFDTTRGVLHGYGPRTAAVRRPAEELLTTLRPFLETWHPRLAAHEHRRTAELSPWEHEQTWAEAEAMRTALAALGQPLRDVVGSLSRISGSDLGTND